MKTAPQQTSLFITGRLCLFGEHSDWAAQFARHAGYCLVTGTDQGMRAVAREAGDFSIETLIPDESGRPSGRTRRMQCPWRAEALLSAARDQEEFFRYCAGVAYEVMLRYGLSNGLEVQITGMDLPLKKGLSSSAAVCILIARAFDAVYDLQLLPHELMELAYRGERLTGSQCGRMDQACIYGRTPVLLNFRTDGEIRVEPVFPGGEIALLLVDLGGRKDTVRILQDLQEAYPDSPQLQRALGEENERIVRRAHRVLGDGDAQGLGELMTHAQEIFDRDVAPHSPTELDGPLLHQVLRLKSIRRHIHGGKGVGSQGDGTAQIVARSAGDRDEAMAKILETFPQMRCFPLTVRSIAN